MAKSLSGTLKAMFYRTAEPEPAEGEKRMDSDTFVSEALAFKQRLVSASGFPELQQLWRTNAFPYTLKETDPFSAAYRAEVLSVYERLVGGAYDTGNEITSSHLSEADFNIGYPWISKDVGVVASELGKAVNGIRAIAQFSPDASSVIEFGAGWGNTAIPLARAGLDVCAVDIDAAFLRRIEIEASAVSANIRTLRADFLDAARNPGQRYDVVMFSSAFHHCLEFEQLLVEIRENVLTDAGSIFFFAEPISNGMQFPWGLRYDGEAVWAITCNKWLELGFSEDFFRQLIERTGFSLTEVPDPSGLTGPGWVARKS